MACHVQAHHTAFALRDGCWVSFDDALSTHVHFCITASDMESVLRLFIEDTDWLHPSDLETSDAKMQGREDATSLCLL